MGIGGGGEEWVGEGEGRGRGWAPGGLGWGGVGWGGLVHILGGWRSGGVDALLPAADWWRWVEGGGTVCMIVVHLAIRVVVQCCSSAQCA